MRIRTPAAILAIALAAAACAGSTSTGGTGGYGGVAPTSTVPSPTGQSTTTGGGKYSYGSTSPAASGGSAASGPVSLTITQSDYQFTPTTPSAKQGATIRITNSAPSTPHTFTITGTPIDITVDPSTSQTVKLDLPPGTYPFVCTYHASHGMKGTLTIKSK